MPFIYILYSPSCDQFYTGVTNSTIENRLERHLIEYYEGNFTVKASDWEIYFHIECNSMKQALQIEKHIKRMKSRKYYIDLKKFSAISEKLKIKYALK